VFHGRERRPPSAILEAVSVSRSLRIAGRFAAAVVVVVGAATAAGFLDRFSWPFEIADVFRLQYLVALVAAGLLAYAARRPTLAAFAVALAAVNLAVLAAPAPSAARGTTSGHLRLVIANVEAGNSDYAAVRRLVAHTRPDLFGVTELTPVMARHLADRLPGYRTRVLRARSDAYGVGVYSRLPLLSAKVVHFPAGGPPTIVARVQVSRRPVTVVVTHVHTPFAGSIHVRHLDALAAAARSEFGNRAVVCGDFNTPPWSGPLRGFARSAHLRDLYGRRAWAGYSWPTWGSLLRVPIDNCFVSKSVSVERHRDGPGIGSDHRPLVVDVGVLT
jgi:endonuclease/exonuclease/phosphatase (EEP) superfamily protein YafD